MNEVKKPRKPLMFYYLIAMGILLLINLFAVPYMNDVQISDVDYSTFIRMTEKGDVAQVELTDYYILFTDQEEEVFYRTGIVNDPNLTLRLYESGAKFNGQIIEEVSPITEFLINWVMPMLLFIGIGQLISRRMMKKMRTSWR